ncbi:hypothetical protein SEA_YABOI_229 [Streptomyces phage Yaboi]|uniref:Uncharacterized protein n=2 Tax=Streptomyces virus Yaboi TaxID=2846408 RepID=A0A385UGZ3_9CAUD|nr:hypothetical protein HWB86_gp097 [Streptomyces phage Yaboi]AYB71022.1 hypothetical protein SEA_YABOI_229 [Streptomyces phage Yaboi]QAY12836.1 hypothetical protein SEA_BOOMERJR_224 [Streptomyces phage BoomerJR]UVD40030.1 hypothetical protein SEA_STANIMAL_224 [Streptomyces phage Stanimal]
MYTPKREVYYTMDAFDLNELVEKEFNTNWDFVSAEECSNDSAHVVHPDLDGFGEDGTEDDEGMSYASARQVIGELIKRNTLPSGKYLIEVCW